MQNIPYKINFRDFKNNAMKSWFKQEANWEKLIQNSEVCSGVGPKSILLPWCMKLEEAKLLCEKYRGRMTIITSSKQQRELFLQLRQISQSTDCTWHNEVWTGFSDEEEEGHFVDVIEGRDLDATVDNQPFFLGQPNGGSLENCASADAKVVSEQSWYDARCDDSILSFCTIDKNPLLQIRGEYIQGGEEAVIRKLLFQGSVAHYHLISNLHPPFHKC